MGSKTYTISELAKEFGVTTRTIRFYEEKGLVQPLRDGQKRLYTPADRVRIKLILRGKRIGMSLQESVDLIDMYDPSRNNTQQLNSLIDNYGGGPAYQKWTNALQMQSERGLVVELNRLRAISMRLRTYMNDSEARKAAVMAALLAAEASGK